MNKRDVSYPNGPLPVPQFPEKMPEQAVTTVGAKLGRHLSALCLLTSFLCPAVFGQSTEFTYQGRLNTNNAPYSGAAEFQFTLWNANSGGNIVATNSPVTVPATVTDGLFSVVLDFGSNPFNGQSRFLQIEVRTVIGPFTTLSPRQALTATPYALSALNVGTNGLAAGDYANAVNFNNVSNSFSGSGAGLTGLNASQLGSGIVPDVLLPDIISSDITGNAATANAVHADVTNAWQSYSVAKINGTGTNTVLHGRITLQNTNSANFTNDNMVIDRGSIFLPSAAWASEAENTWGGRIIWDYLGGSRFFDEGGSSQPMALIGTWNRWGGTPNNPWLKVTSANVRIEEGWSYGGYSGEIHIGNEDHFGSVVVNYTPLWNGGSLALNTTGKSHPLVFRAVYTLGAGGYNFSAATIQARATSTGLNGPGGNQSSMAELDFLTYEAIPTSSNVSNAFSNYPGLRIGTMLTNGWDLRGRLIQEQAAYAYATTTVALDFNAPIAQSITLNGQGTNLVTVTNVQGGSKNFEARTFKIHTGTVSRNFIWPANWTVISESGANALPLQVAALKILHLKMESWGSGDSNIVVQFGIGTDNTFVIDTDAESFITRAGVTNEIQKAAVDYLAKSLKENNLWTNMIALYPFVGGTSNSHAVNLKSASFNITFTASGITHDANGITGDGLSGYGDTGLKPLTHLGAASVSNSHLLVYCRTQTGVPGKRYASVANNAGTYRFGLAQNGTSLQIDGPMNASAPTTYNNVGGDFRGVLGVSRDGSNPNAFSVISRSSITAQSNAATGVPDYELTILARNFEGYGSDSYSSANLALLSVGWGYTSNELYLVRQIVENYQTILARKIP